MKRAAREPGRVLLVGAGPGDPDLLTLRALRALEAADVVLADDLVDTRVLGLVRGGARIVHVGKRGGRASTPQGWINRLLVREARAGATVVRLKGGDPFVFGRGGEEQEALAKAGIACELVPGITAGIGAAHAAAVPLTHRACAQGVIFLTGHTADGRGPDWNALVATRMTLVIYMGLARCRMIAGALVAAGMDPATPVAIVQAASTTHERTVVTTLSALDATLSRENLRSPAILIVGDVVRHRAMPPVVTRDETIDLRPMSRPYHVG